VDYDEVTSIYVADVDGDGNLDVLATSEDENSVAWWENKDGAGTLWSKHIVSEAFYGAASVYAADVNSDGNMDVVGTDYGSGDVAWWENTDGTGTHWLRHLVDGDAYCTTSVYAADLDGDGDQDVLSVSNIDFSVIWWENTNGAGTAWTEHIVDDDFHWAYDVNAADLDGDGDQDVLATSLSDSSVIWWENTNGAGTTWTKHVVDDYFNQPSSISVADVDGDGDADVVGAADLAGEIVWWENRGGQFRLNTGATAPGRMAPGAADDVLKITMTHLGRSGDSSEEFASLKLLFEGCYGNGCTPNSPLTSDQAHELFDALHIYRDDGDGAFDSASDNLVDANITSFSLVDGVQTITFHDGGGNLRVDYGAPETYFVVLDRVDSVPAAATISRFRVTHVSEAGSSAEDRSYDTPLLIEYAPNMATDSISIALPPQGADDGGAGFETTEDTAFVTANVLSNDSYTDGDGLSVTDFDASGTLGLVSHNGDGTFHYDPNGQFGDLLHGQSASDSFSYTVSDGVSTATATVTITVTGGQDGFYIHLPLVLR
jgi:VCBS repeat-containing protein